MPRAKTLTEQTSHLQALRSSPYMQTLQAQGE